MQFSIHSRHFRALLAISVIAACLIVVACGGSDSDNDPTAASTTPTTSSVIPPYTGPGELRTIQSGTQLHLDGVDIGTGNIWEEEYTSEAGQATHGLTALLAVTVVDDPAQNLNLRVHPDQDVTVPGYRLHVVAIEAERIHLAVIEKTP